MFIQKYSLKKLHVVHTYTLFMLEILSVAVELISSYEKIS